MVKNAAREATVDIQPGGCDVVGLLREEEKYSVRYILGLAHAADQGDLAPGLFNLGVLKISDLPPIVIPLLMLPQKPMPEGEA